MAETAPTRGRVVMLVDNNVTPDSRVQKQARSMADRGWDVTLLGKKAGGSDRSAFTLGKAKVRLLTVPGRLHVRRHLMRRAVFRSPFAYPPGQVADYKLQQNKARKTDLRFRRAELAVGNHPWAALRTLWLGVMLFIAKAKGRWVRYRYDRTESLEGHRHRMDGRTDRFTNALWPRLMGSRSWRKLEPGFWDWELAYGPVVDKLKPDVIHANDFRMLAVGAHAKSRARDRGRVVKLVWDAHEFLPGIKSWSPHPRWHVAHCALEREFAPHADAVVTVSEEVGELLVKEHSLAERPTVVLNAPVVHDDERTIGDIRSFCGLAESTPLLVYSGVAGAHRGLGTMVEALSLLDGVHIAFVVAYPAGPYAQELLARAAELGVSERVHISPYVPVEDIVPYLSGADIGVIPIHHWPNHEISLITKFFEYSHARLPIVVSDVKAMSEMVRQTGQGEVFLAEDVEDFARSVSKILSNRSAYVGAYDRPGLLDAWTWERQADRLCEVYAQTLGRSAERVKVEA